MNFWTRWDKKDPANTYTSLLLKRQIPIRFNEEPRSWLGGLPMMPKGMKWPRDAAGDPLHFIAQIACADIPPALWNGLGPRKGWLLLFLQFHKFEEDTTGGEATDGAVQVLHTSTLGVEHAPPDDLATVRHAMSDDIGRYTSEIRPGVPKLWRKWPVDLVVHQYRASDEELEANGPPTMSAGDLYKAPMSEHGITDIPLDRPLTWRGALYVAEGVLRDLTPDNFERNGGLLDFFEGDRDEYSYEYNRRAKERNIYQFDEGGTGSPYERREARIKAMADELANERRTGWMKRVFVALEKAKNELEKERDEFQQMINTGLRAETGVLLDVDRPWVEETLQGKKDALNELEKHRVYMTRIQDEYPGPEGEARLAAEFKRLGEAHLARIPEQRAHVQRLLARLLAQDLDAPLPEAEWHAIQTSLDTCKSTYWRENAVSLWARTPEKVECGVAIGSSHIEMAVREDVLDLYTRPDGKHPTMTPAFVEEIEKKLRCMETPHRMGGMASAQGAFDLGFLQHDPIAFVRGQIKRLATPKLVFQIASDDAMGWMWGDLRALNVAVSSTALRLNRFKRVHAWIEGY